MKVTKLIRPGLAVIVMIIAASAPPGGAQPPPAGPSQRAGLDKAKQLDEQVQQLSDAGKLQDAISAATQALALRQQLLEPDHRDTATSLNCLAGLYQDAGSYEKAEPLFLAALKIRQRILKFSHPDVAESLNDLGDFYRTTGALDKAETLLVRALDIRQKVFGRMHPDVAITLNNLGLVYRAQGAFAKAEPVYLRALQIKEEAFGPWHPLVASSLNNLAALYRLEGAYSRAEPLYRRALAIYEQIPGPKQPRYASCLTNLAELYVAQGAYYKAEPLLIRALEILQSALGDAHPQVAHSLNELASLYQDQGAYDKAEPLFVRACDIIEQALGSSHPFFVMGLNNLGSLYRERGEYSKAERILVRVLALREKTLRPGHPDIALSLSRLSVVYREQGAYDKAESLAMRALAIDESALGPGHSEVGLILNNLAVLHAARGAYAKAELLLLRALGIKESTLGPTHPQVAVSVNQLAGIYWAEGAYNKVEPQLARAASIQEQLLRNELVRLSEPRKRALVTLQREMTDTAISFHIDGVPGSASARELAFTTALQRKGRILDALVDSETGLRRRLTPEVRGLLDQLARARSDLVAQRYPPTTSRSSVNPGAVRATRERIDELDAKISAHSAEYRLQVEPITLAKLRSALPAGGALVEFVRYHRFDPRRLRSSPDERYVVYLLTADGPLQAVELGGTAPIDAQVHAVLASLRGQASRRIVRAALRRLDASVLAPVRARLSGVTHLILGPDGELNLIPFEALVDAQGRYAVESYLVSYLTSGRDLLRLGTSQAPRSAGVILGAPDYGSLSPVAQPGAMSFAPLRGALEEAADLRPYFATVPVTGADASKAALGALTGPAMLHIATHGFYTRGATTPRPRAPRALSEASRGMFVEDGASSALPADDLMDALDDSGLAMARANQGPDGILTAREIAGFDWWGTQLVVLSACDTGVGAVMAGDGVYGLRRALVLAGAATQVVSLWGVDDAATRALMRSYYDKLARGTGRAEALRQAKLTLLRQPSYDHPYYWAAFISAGDWRALGPNTISPPGLR